MMIIVNGEGRHVATGVSIRDVLEALELPMRKIAVERNLEIVPRSTYETQTLMEGDRLEIVQFVGGG